MCSNLVRFIFVLASFATRECFSHQQEYDFTVSNRAFAAAVYKELAKTEPGNFLTCPLSVQTVMALTSLGAKGKTSEQISQGLKLPSDTNLIKNIFKQLMPQLRGNEYYSLTSANKLFVHNSFKLNRNYQEDAMKIFDADVDNIDFKHNYAAADNINQWVQKKTNNKIQKLVAPDDISPDTKLILANALHFKGKWKVPFDTVDTIKRPFYTSTHEAHNVDMMQLTDFFSYYENKELDAKFLELPYQGNDVSMVFVLPNKINGLDILENRMEQVLEEQPYTKQHVRIQIPKFSMETTSKYKPILQQLGIEKVFTPDADLSNITPSGNLLINNVLQKTFINVTETGTEAAAATAVVEFVNYWGLINFVYLDWTMDHPSIFYLRMKTASTNHVLFTLLPIQNNIPVNILERIGEEEVFSAVPFIADHAFFFVLVHRRDGAHIHNIGYIDSHVEIAAAQLPKKERNISADATSDKQTNIIFTGRFNKPI